MGFRYYGAFVSGMQEVVGEILRERLPEAKVEKLLDGGILFESSCEYSRLNFFCFNNIFAVVSVMEHPAPEGALEAHMRAACKRKGPCPVIAENNQKIRSFRLITSRENKLVPVEEKLKRNAEAFIAALSRLRVDRARPDTEFWFLYRREGCSLFMKRLTKHPSTEKALHRGELPPQLAYMMCWMSKPKGTDIVADPFCGYGSIPEQRLKRFPLEQCYAFDIDEEALAFTRAKLGAARGLARVEKAELSRLPELLPEAGLDAIITDPPWGIYAETALPLREFYRLMLEVFAKLLKPEGIVVLLTAGKEELRLAAEAPGGLCITGAVPVLVSGRKAAIFTLKKKIRE